MILWTVILVCASDLPWWVVLVALLFEDDLVEV